MFASASILALFALIMVFAWLKGDEPEKNVATILMIVYLLSLLRAIFVGAEAERIDFYGFSVDLLAFVWISTIALRAVRVWPIWAAALQLLAIFSHLVQLMKIDIDPIAYGIMRAGPSYFVWIVLLIGTLLHIQRLRSGDRRPSWRNWSQLSSQTLRH